MRTIERDIVGVFIFSKDGKILLGKGGVYADQWIVPGGGIDEGESAISAVKRETLEETGLDIPETDFIPIEGGPETGESEKTLRDTGERVKVIMKFTNFKTTLPTNAEDTKLAIEDDFTDARWFSISELDGLPKSPPTIQTLKALGIHTN